MKSRVMENYIYILERIPKVAYHKTKHYHRNSFVLIKIWKLTLYSLEAIGLLK